MERYYKRNWTDIVEDLNTDIQKGLPEYECIAREEQISSNRIDFKNNKKLTLKSICSTWNIINTIAIMAILIYTKNYFLLTLTIYLYIINIVYRGYVVLKDYRRLKELDKLNYSKAVAIREGCEVVVEAEELVIGDIVVLRPGSFIGADLRIIRAEGLKVNDKNITGEDIIKEKQSAALNIQPFTLGQISNMLFRGSKVLEGRGLAVVVKCGSDTELGRLLYSIGSIDLKKNNLIKDIDSKLIKSNIILIILALILYMIFPGSGYVKNNLLISIIFSTTNVLVPVISIIYSTLIRRELEKEDISISKLSTLIDSTDTRVVFIDKIGSITSNEYKLRKMFSEGKYINEDQFRTKEINFKRMLDILYINSNLFKETGLEDDCIQHAYSECYESIGYPIETVKLYNKFHYRVTRDSENPFFTTVTKSKKGFRVNVRGDLESVLSRCTHILINGVEKPLNEIENNKIRVAESVFSREGLNIEAIAYRSFAYEPLEGANIQNNLVFVGMTALENVLIEGIEETIKDALDNRVLPIIFTEDNRVMAEAIGRKIGIISSVDEVITGQQLRFTSDKEFYRLVAKGVIFSKVSQVQRIKIIDAFYKDGFSIASEGENLIQISSFVRSKISIARGEASDLIKNLTDVYSTKDSIKSIMTIKKHGNNIREGMTEANYTYIKFLSAQIIISFIYYLTQKGVLFTPYTLIALNSIALVPMVLLSLGFNNDNPLSTVKKNISTFIYIVVPSIAVTKFANSTEFMIATMLVANMFITFLLTCKYNIKNLITVIIGLIVSSIAMVGVAYNTNAVIDKNLIITLLASIGIYTILIGIIKFWRK